MVNIYFWNFEISPLNFYTPSFKQHDIGITAFYPHVRAISSTRYDVAAGKFRKKVKIVSLCEEQNTVTPFLVGNQLRKVIIKGQIKVSDIADVDGDIQYS